MINPQQEQQLTSSGECYLHYHPDDRVPTHDTLNRLQNLAAPQSFSGTEKTLTYSDDYIECHVTCTITLPRSRAGKEFEVTVMEDGITVSIVPTGTDTVQGTDLVYSSIQWTSLRFKSITGGYILI